MSVVILIVSFVIAIVLVNWAYKLFMKIMGANAMFFSMKTKLLAIIVVGVIIMSLLGKLFGFG